MRGLLVPAGRPTEVRAGNCANTNIFEILDFTTFSFIFVSISLLIFAKLFSAIILSFIDFSGISPFRKRSEILLSSRRFPGVFEATKDSITRLTNAASSTLMVPPLILGGGAEPFDCVPNRLPTFSFSFSVVNNKLALFVCLQ